MQIPPYFKQEKLATCSLASLRMALGYFDIKVTEKELEEQVKSEYGTRFKNLWNTTIAKLACEYGLDVTLAADWPLLREGVLGEAMKAYKEHPLEFNIMNYENPADNDHLPEPLPLAYKEMFLAVENGCHTLYKPISKEVIITTLQEGVLIQTTIKRNKFYPGNNSTYHSLLLYKTDGEKIFFHDPSEGAEMATTIDHLVYAATDVGAYMIYKK